ncbi:MAG: S8 family serine peptidase [bacterium]|nr:S8 family serine peptidase [bacterium]
MNIQTKMNRSVAVFAVVALVAGGAGAGSFAPHTAHASARVNVFIGFTHTPGASEQALVRAFGGEISHSYHLVPAIAASVPESAVEGLLKNPRVAYVEADGTVYAIDAELDSTWGVQRVGSGTVHDSGNSGTGVKVAIIDSGIDYTHPDLDANFAGGYDFVNNDTDPMDDNGHGTHVAGTVAAEDNDTGVVGVAPTASLYGLKVLSASGSGSWSNIIAALEWAVDNGIQVTNNSYGAGSDPGSTVKAAFDNSAAVGISHVAAAGNSGNCKGNNNTVGFPARYDSVIAVAATNKSDTRPCFSSTGPAVELSAPGVSINSTQLGGGYVEFNGTSMASPHVAGAAALVIAAGISDANGNGLINDEVRLVLNDTAEDLGDTGRDNKYGWGLVSAALAVAAVGPVEPPAPAVTVVLSADKTNYVSGTDTTATITAAVADENSGAISGLGASVFVMTLDGADVTVTFTETATLGTYTGSLDISSLVDGTYTIETTVTDTRDISGSGSATFSVGPAPIEATTAGVNSINYTTSGGKNSDRHLSVTVAVADNLGDFVSGASVSLTLSHDSGKYWNGTGATGTAGTVTFELKNAPSGCYETVVTSVVIEGLAWDGVTSTNEFCK